MLRWGILGTGFISHTVAQAIDASTNSTIAAVAGRDGDRVANFQHQHQIPVATTDYHEVAARDDVDAIYIGTPNHTHHEFAIVAARAGKAVLSEKSLTTAMPDARALLDATDEHQTFFVEGLMYLAHPLIERFVEVLDDGRLGTPRSIHGRYGADIWRLVNPAGGGTIYNLGCYPASLLQLTMQTLGGDAAFGQRTLTATGNVSVEDNTVTEAVAAIRFENGVLATLQSSDRYGNVSDFSVAGDNGVLRFVSNPWLPQPGSNSMTWTPNDPDDAPETIVVTDPHDAFHHQIAMVERCVAEGRLQAPRPSPRWNDSLELMELLTDWEQRCR